MAEKRNARQFHESGTRPGLRLSHKNLFGAYIKEPAQRKYDAGKDLYEPIRNRNRLRSKSIIHRKHDLMFGFSWDLIAAEHADIGQPFQCRECLWTTIRNQ